LAVGLGLSAPAFAPSASASALPAAGVVLAPTLAPPVGWEPAVTPDGREPAVTPDGREPAVTPDGREPAVTPDGRLPATRCSAMFASGLDSGSGLEACAAVGSSVLGLSVSWPALAPEPVAGAPDALPVGLAAGAGRVADSPLVALPAA
jgi:hypothetical protein